MANGEYSINIFLSFLSIDLGAAMLAPSYSLTSRVSVIRSFLLQDIPRHPDTRLFEVREAFKRSLLLGFQAPIRAYIAIFHLRRPSGGPPGGSSGGPPVVTP